MLAYSGQLFFPFKTNKLKYKVYSKSIKIINLTQRAQNNYNIKTSIKKRKRRDPQLIGQN